VAAAMLAETSCVPCAACWTLAAISRVAAPCCSTAEAMEDEISGTCSMTVPIPLVASTAL